MPTEYDPTLTMDANARALCAYANAGHMPYLPYAEAQMAKALRAAYVDGWDEARSRQLAGLDIEEDAP